MTELAERSRHLWLELWNNRDLDAMREEMHPEHVLIDHRTLSDDPSQSHWEQMSRGWWELVPDTAVVEHEVLAEASEKLVAFVLFRGHDSVSGGLTESAVFVVTSVRDDLWATADLFDDADAALAFFAEKSGV